RCIQLKKLLEFKTNLMGRCTYSDPPRIPTPPYPPQGGKKEERSDSCPPLSRGGAPVPALFVRGDRILCSLIKNWYKTIFLFVVRTLV
ncbi:MAG: hypothetical protein EA000_00975, partial [Oscillatoriales cyanobacterium]